MLTPNDLIVELSDSDIDSEIGFDELQNLASNKRRLRSTPPLSLESKQSDETLMIAETASLREPLERNPASVLKDRHILAMKLAYSLPSSAVFRSPLPNETADSASFDEIAVYEVYFNFGFRGVVPALIVEMANFFGICPSQFSPCAWGTLTALQVFGDLFCIDVGVKEVLYSYYFRPVPLEESRYMIHIRTAKSRLVHGVRDYEREWRKKFVFLKVGSTPGFPVTWFKRGVSVSRTTEGKANSDLVINEDIKYRSFDFLTHEITLKSSTIRGLAMSINRSRVGDDTFARFMTAAASKLDTAARLPVPNPSSVEIPSNGKRKTLGEASKTTTLKPAKAVRRTIVEASSSPQLEAVTHSDRSSTVSELNAKVFSSDFHSHDAVGAETVIDQLQVALFQGMSACNYLKEKSFSSTKEKGLLQESIDKLREELHNEKEKVVEAMSTITFKDNEIACLKKQMLSRDLVISGVRAENASLKKDNTLLKGDVEFCVTGAIIETRWEMIKAWKEKKTSDWDVSAAEKLYNQVKVVQGKVKGLSQDETAASPAGVTDNCAIDSSTINVCVSDDHVADVTAASPEGVTDNLVVDPVSNRSVDVSAACSEGVTDNGGLDDSTVDVCGTDNHVLDPVPTDSAEVVLP